MGVGGHARGRSAGCGSTYTLMQMNLCLSGLAGCYGKAAYPAVVEEAVARIRKAHPDAVTFNEACRSDVAWIARRTGYHLSFSSVISRGEPLRCIRPGSRGLFGDAVLTKAAIASTDSHDFQAQAGTERRRWLCVATRVGVDVCTAHLNTRSTSSRRERRAVRRTRGPPCTPRSTRPSPSGATSTVSHLCPRRRLDPHRRVRAPGTGPPARLRNGALRSPSAEVVPATHTDHDVLLVRSHLAAPE